MRKTRKTKRKKAYAGARTGNLGTNQKEEEESEDTDGKRLRAVPEGPALRVFDHGGYGRYVGGMPDSCSIGQDILSLPVVELVTRPDEPRHIPRERTLTAAPKLPTGWHLFRHAPRIIGIPTCLLHLKGPPRRSCLGYRIIPHPA